jgi:hypothetical protein
MTGHYRTSPPEDGTERLSRRCRCDAIHDQAHPDKVLRSTCEVLKPGGTYFMLDEAGSSNLEENLDHPLGPFLYAASVLHCMTVSLAQGGAGLGTMWGSRRRAGCWRKPGSGT